MLKITLHCMILNFLGLILKVNLLPEFFTLLSTPTPKKVLNLQIKHAIL